MFRCSGREVAAEDVDEVSAHVALPRTIGPRVASRIRDGEEGPPVIGLAIIQVFGHRWVGDSERVSMVGHPADSAAAEGVELASQLGAADPVYRLAGRTAAHRQDD